MDQTDTPEGGPDIQYRAGVRQDALCVGVLATQVFLDTYATQGVSPDLAREVLAGYSCRAFEARLENAATSFVLAENAGHLVGFVEVSRSRPCPVRSVSSDTELARLYVQRGFQRQGIGRHLLRRGEETARESGEAGLWLTAWSGNARALEFYAALGFRRVGTVEHLIEGHAYENVVFEKTWDARRDTSPASKLANG